MRRILIAATLLAFTSACSEKEEGENPDTNAILALTGNADDGQAVYDAKCSSCHKADGTGDASLDYPSLVEELPGSDGEEPEFVSQILDGRGTMPAFRDQLSDQEVADVLAYILREWR